MLPPEPPETPPREPALDADADAPRLESAQHLDLAALLAMWQGRNLDRWSRSPRAYRLLADRLLAAGEPLMAYDVSDEGLQTWPVDVRLRQLQGLALARSGAPERAQHILAALYADGQRDEETVGILARTYKDLYFATRPLPGAPGLLRTAATLYAEAYALHGGYWSGINAATLQTLLGERVAAFTIARAVRDQCARLLETLPDGADSYWLVATLGEANLVLADWPQAAGWYARAAAEGRQRLGDLASTRRNARLLLADDAAGLDRMQQVLHLPSVAVFTGHMVDHPNRAVPRFPRASEPAIAQAIRERLVRHDCQIGYASLAAGADVLFLEAVLELGGEITVVLPYAQDHFLRDNAQVVGDSSWTARCERVLARAARVIVAGEQESAGGSTTFEFANLMLDGLAANRAEHLETELIRLAVWDGHPGDGPGGTASAVGRWQHAGLPVEIVTPPAVSEAGLERRLRPPAGPVRAPSPAPVDSGFRSQIVAILFGDAVHFSKLAEAEIIRFGEHFLGAIGKLIGTSTHPPVLKNTWGDGLFFVFASVREAGLFALSLRDLINGTDWASKGLPAGLNLRIALHAGAVFSYRDPITGRPNYLGTQVSRAARIEPVTPPGHVYASEAFAALTAAERVADFTCDYVGQTPLAKSYGTFPLYHVRPT